MKKYSVFTRTWRKFNKTWPNGLEPFPGEKTYIKHFDTEEEAREYCQYHNANSLPEKNPLSFKYEFTEKY